MPCAYRTRHPKAVSPFRAGDRVRLKTSPQYGTVRAVHDTKASVTWDTHPETTEPTTNLYRL